MMVMIVVVMVMVPIQEAVYGQIKELKERRQGRKC
jgi:hypothetical protein